MEEFSDVWFTQCAVIIHRRMQAVYGDQCVDVSTVRRWVRWFKDGELGEADLSDKTRRTNFKNLCSIGRSVLKCVDFVEK
jgi:hypothetical protein